MGLTPEQIKLAEKMKKQSKGSYKESRHKDPVVGGDLPSGITGGVAKFTDYVFKEQEGTGKISVNLIGTVVRPEEFAGQRAAKMHFLSESEFNTIEQAYADFYADLQLMGVDTRDDDHEDLAQIFVDLEELKKEEALFKFNTWRSNKAGARTKIFIQGIPDEAETTEILEHLANTADPDVDDSAEPEPEADDASGAEPPEDSSDDAAGEEEPWSGPEVGEEYGYRQNSRQKVKNHTVKTVNQGKQTCQLVRVEDGQVFKDVPWDKLADAV